MRRARRAMSTISSRAPLVAISPHTLHQFFSPAASSRPILHCDFPAMTCLTLLEIARGSQSQAVTIRFSGMKKCQRYFRFYWRPSTARARQSTRCFMTMPASTEEIISFSISAPDITMACHNRHCIATSSRRWRYAASFVTCHFRPRAADDGQRRPHAVPSTTSRAKHALRRRFRPCRNMTVGGAKSVHGLAVSRCSRSNLRGQGYHMAHLAECGRHFRYHFSASAEKAPRRGEALVSRWAPPCCMEVARPRIGSRPFQRFAIITIRISVKL